MIAEHLLLVRIASRLREDDLAAPDAREVSVIAVREAGFRVIC